MQDSEDFGAQSAHDVSEMPASSILMNSPQFSRVLEQMNDSDNKVFNAGMKKKASPMWKSMPSIQVTCFDDDAYNEKILNQLENPPATAKETSTVDETSVSENLATQQNNETHDVCLNNSSSDEAYKSISTATEVNSAVDNNREGVLSKKNTQPLRKCSKGFVVSSQTPNRMITKTKTENNDTETKRESSNEGSTTTGQDELKGTEHKTARKPSLDSRHSDSITSPSMRRRRYTVCALSGDNPSSNAPQNNSELNNGKRSVSVVQNSPRSPKLGDRKLSSENMINGKKKPERIDLSFKMDLTTNGAAQFRNRSQTYGGQTQKQKHSRDDSEAKTSSVDALKRSSSDEQLMSGGGFRTYDDNQRLGDGSLSLNVDKLPRDGFQRKESNKSLGISENSSLTLLKDAGVAGNDTRNPSRRPQSARRVSTSVLQGVKSASLGINENTRLSRDAKEDVTQRLNLASPPRTRRVGTPRPPPPRGERPSLLGVSANRTLSKSETDLRKLVSEEDDVETPKRVSLSASPRVRRLSDVKPGDMKTSLGVSGKLSLSKSETDLRKLVSEEERADARRPSLSSPQRVRKLSPAKPLTTSDLSGSLASSPLSPRLERKIYLAAAKTAARLPIRAKTRNDLQASSQVIIDQAEKELDELNEQLPHISMEEVMKSWKTDSRHWNMVSSLVNPNVENSASKTNMEAVKNCRYIREGVVKKKKHSN